MSSQTNWILFIFLLLLAGCYEQKEGCLDPNALNFDVSADKDCCCTYPNLKLLVNYKANDSTSFSYVNYYTDAGGHVYKINSFSFFLTHLEVQDDSDMWIDVKDSSEYWIYGGANEPEKVLVSENVSLIKHDVLSYDLGSIKGGGIFRKVSLGIGLDSLQERVIPDSLSENHPLGLGVETMWRAPKTYLQQRWIVVTDTSAANYKIDTFEVMGERKGVDMVYNPSYLLSKGTDYKMKIAINITKWLETVDWHAPKSEISQELVNNSSSALSLVQ
ncbi:MAG TPA: hypothetical protein ENK85_12340 [Saprospiraceae bacterium]|nr:hypothetical protein [Saprospiraceae bacterium]